MEKFQRRQWIEGSTSPHQKSVSGSSSATDRHLTRLLCCVHRVKLKERKRFVVRHQNTLSFERNYLLLSTTYYLLTFSTSMVLKMLLDRRDLCNVRLSLDLDANSARHTYQLDHVITEEKETIHQEVIGAMERTCEESTHPPSSRPIENNVCYSITEGLQPSIALRVSSILLTTQHYDRHRRHPHSIIPSPLRPAVVTNHHHNWRSTSARNTSSTEHVSMS